MVQPISSDHSLQSIISANRSILIVIDFYAEWCEPCRMIAPVFEQLPQQFSTGVLFLKVNADRCAQTLSSFGIEALPTFLFLINGKEVDRVRGADPRTLQEKIIHYVNIMGHSATSSGAPTDGERSFLERFVSYAKQMVTYEEDIAQTLALSLIPISRIEERSMENGEVSKILLLKNLMKWFKTEFFTWIDVPQCSRCSKTASKDSMTRETASPDEARFGAYVTEVYNCESCSKTVRFPRFNDPVKLLETRRGRCAEWANCFVLCCRALKYEARLVLDVTDHVWCEFWIPELDRWVHCDPCEAVCDTPLLYERGWGKKLSYVIAFAVDHVRDVTWRYTFNHREILMRRTLCRESVLKNFLLKLNVEYQNTLSKERKEELQRRYLKELVEFLSPKLQVREDSKEECQGRITGSEEWKRARGEMGCGNPQTSFVISPTNSEISNKLFCLQYYCSQDLYRRGGQIIRGWKAFLFKHVDIFRKEELDWKMVYLCRKKDAEIGELCWLFDFGSNEVQELKVFVKGMAEFHTGEVLATICADGICQKIPKDGVLKVSKVSGKVEIKVLLFGGVGRTAWQHAQLFRSELSSKEPDLTIIANFV